MVNQPKRIVMETAAVAFQGQMDVMFGPGTGSILRRLTNYHNLWWSLSVEPEAADANAGGIWVLWLRANTNNPVTDWSQATIDADNNTMEVIACGVWAASNQSPFNFSSQLKSSRNLVANQELVLSVNVHGLTAGNARVRSMMCSSLSVK